MLEVTLRTPNAFEAIESMAKVDGAIVAAGTVIHSEQVSTCKSAGASFLVSPGYTDSLINSTLKEQMPLLPGAATASEMMALAEHGYHFLKFFPASINGGIPALKAYSSPLPQLRFCPTGGISESNVNDYLTLPNVTCVGGSWLVTQDDLDNKDWKNIRAKVKALKI